jgi:arginase
VKLHLDVIQVASDIGGPAPGAALGPQALRVGGLAKRLTGARWWPELRPEAVPAPLPAPLPRISELSDRLAARTAKSVAAGRFPLVLGGDHACAIGTWQGISAAVAAPIGLLWIDAHMDSHTLETSETGNIHGMPLAALLGHGAPELCGGLVPQPALLPQHVCLVGVRSFESGEAALLERLGVRIFMIDEVERRGLDAVLADALDIVRQAEGGFGLSFDIDALDPNEAPGVTVPEERGLHAADVRRAFAAIGRERGLIGVEIVEYNPLTDRDGQTARLVVDLAATLFEEAHHVSSSRTNAALAPHQNGTAARGEQLCAPAGSPHPRSGRVPVGRKRQALHRHDVGLFGS